MRRVIRPEHQVLIDAGATAVLAHLLRLRQASRRRSAELRREDEAGGGAALWDAELAQYSKDVWALLDDLLSIQERHVSDSELHAAMTRCLDAKAMLSRDIREWLSRRGAKSVRGLTPNQRAQLYDVLRERTTAKIAEGPRL